MNLPSPTRGSLEGERFHVIVIGGGLNGAAIARACACAGKRTLLLEQNDFASGATSHCVRLLHDGLEHIMQGDVSLARESARRQEQFLAEHPHLAHPKKLLVASNPRKQRSLKQRTNLWLYKQIAGTKSSDASEIQEFKALENALTASGHSPFFQYEEAQHEFPERLVMEWLLQATGAGTIVRNHAQVLAIDVRQGRARGVLVRDKITGAENRLEATWIVNAGGAWAERLMQRSRIRLQDALSENIRRTCIVLPMIAGLPDVAVQFDDSDAGTLHIVPWNRQLLVAGPALSDSSDPGKTEPSYEECEQILHSLQILLPGLRVTFENIRCAFAGVFAEPRGRSNAGNYALRHHEEDGAASLISIVGGGPAFAEEASNALLSLLGSGKQRNTQPKTDDLLDDWTVEIAEAARINQENASSIAEWHGPRSIAIADLAKRDVKMRAALCSHTEHIVAEAVDAFANEFAFTLADVLLRRVPVALGPCWSAACSREAVARLCAVMGWTEQQAAAELETLEMERSTFQPSLKHAGIALPTAAD